MSSPGIMPSSEGQSSDDSLDLSSAVMRYMLTRGESFRGESRYSSARLPLQRQSNNTTTTDAAAIWPWCPPQEQSNDNPPKPCHLCSLSNELLCMIAQHLDPSKLAKFARTCKLLYNNVTPILYKSIIIDDCNGREVFPKLARGCIWYDWHNFNHIQKFDVSMPWYSKWSAKFPAINHIEDMSNLRHLAIEFGNGDELRSFEKRHTMHLPSRLPAKLETCTLKFRAGDWDIIGIVPLLKHRRLRRLEMHSGASDPMSQNVNIGDDDEYKGIECTSPKSTSLESLTLINCGLTRNDLHELLCYPRALQYLSICASNSKTNYGVVEDPDRYVVWENTFNDIAREVGKSLLGFRFERSDGPMVPAPGIHKLKHLRYLEIHHHLLAPISPFLDDADPNNFDHPPLDQLLPPKIEVLKIVNFDCSTKGFEIINEILENKEEIVPCLRRIILLFYYQDEKMERELRALVEEAKYSARKRDELKLVLSRRPVTPVWVHKDEHVELEGRCKAKGVELMILYENVVRMEVLREGAGRAVWEIEEQIA
ncbi:hypothetical protein DL98DRAFT_70664 [Cadophora sp. DSE1049]|nr:hypothetical protein DL98DRAFT_70664 [Cadophora sp. DSE1049]